MGEFSWAYISGGAGSGPDGSVQVRHNAALSGTGNFTYDFDNGIFCTVPDDTMEGVVWIVRKADGERITFCRTQSDVDSCVAELMRQRLSL